MKIFDCAIVGGGFTGLAAAHRLSAEGHCVVILERDASLGGLASGFMIGDFELERFYHHWFTNDAYVTELAHDIGKADQILTRPTRTGMYFSGNFYRLSTPLDLLRFKALSFSDRIRTGLATLALRRIKDWKSLESITAKDWLIKYFGKRVYKVVWEPLLVGKFGEFADDVSAVWFWKKLDLRGSSRGTAGNEMLAYYKGGFGKLARDVGDRVEEQGGQIRLKTTVESLTVVHDETVTLATSNGDIQAKNVLITTPLPITASILQDTASPEFVRSLNKINYLSNVCLILELDRSLSGIYWLNVNDPSFPFVGIIEHTNFEPTESYGGKHIVYLSRYLPKTDAIYSMTPEELLTFAVPHIKRMFPTFDESWILDHHMWRADYAQPIVEKHYSKVVPNFETPVPKVYISTMAQVYPEDRGTNYAIREGRQSAARISASLKAGQPRS